jgi:hypothetical protein
MKEEKATYDQQKREEEKNKTLFEKPVAYQLDVSLEELRTEMPLEPAWGVKKTLKVRTNSGMVTKLISLLVQRVKYSSIDYEFG